MANSKKDLEKEVGRIIDNKDQKPTVVLAVIKEEKGIKAAVMLENTNIKNAAKLLLISLIDGQASEKSPVDGLLNSLKGIMPEELRKQAEKIEGEVSGDFKMKAYKRLIFSLLEDCL